MTGTLNFYNLKKLSPKNRASRGLKSIVGPYHMRCTNAKQVIFIGVHSVRRGTAFTVARAHVADAGCLGSVVECCGSALLSVTSSVWRGFFLGMLACRLGLSSPQSSPTIGSFRPRDK